MRQMILSSAIGYAKKEVIRRTFLAGYGCCCCSSGHTEIWKIVDNPWRIGIVRARRLISPAFRGSVRPVTSLPMHS
jgi:hypothetical protein